VLAALSPPASARPIRWERLSPAHTPSTTASVTDRAAAAGKFGMRQKFQMSVATICIYEPTLPVSCASQ
jgi:hypothetical protein